MQNAKKDGYIIHFQLFEGGKWEGEVYIKSTISCGEKGAYNHGKNYWRKGRKNLWET